MREETGGIADVTWTIDLARDKGYARSRTIFVK